MAMKAKGSLDATNFNALVKELQQISGASYRDIIRAEASSILTASARSTKVTTIKKIDQSHKPIYEGGGREFAKYDGKTYYLRNKIPDSAFHAITKRLKERVKYLKSVRGLARKTWFVIGRQIGIPVKVAAFVSKPKPSNVDSFVNGLEEAEGKKYTLTIENKSKMIPHTGMAYALRRAIMGRISFFQKNLRSGVFSDLKARSSKYPGITWK